MPVQDSMNPTEQTQYALLEKLLHTPWSELEAIEFDHLLYFPEKLHIRRKNGECESIDIMLRIPRPDEMRWARVEARNRARSEGLDLKLDADLVDDLETVYILTKAIRYPSSPYEPYEPDPAILERKYDKRSLSELWAKLDALVNIVDPRPSDLSKEEVLAVIAAIAKTREIYPLHGLAPRSQSHCIVSMASMVMLYLASRSSSEPSDSSTPE